MPKYNMYDIRNGKTIKTCIAKNLQEANRKLGWPGPGQFPYVYEDTEGKVETSVRESRAYAVALREAGPTLGSVQVTVINAVSADVAASHGVEVFMDGEVRYSVGSDLFSRTWAISPEGEVTLGQPYASGISRPTCGCRTATG
jgi:hypothetical protein